MKWGIPPISRGYAIDESRENMATSSGGIPDYSVFAWQATGMVLFSCALAPSLTLLKKYRNSVRESLVPDTPRHNVACYTSAEQAINHWLLLINTSIIDHI
jgi:hypothetical protein